MIATTELGVHRPGIRTVLVVSGGEDLTPAEIEALPVADCVIAADSGLDRAIAAGIEVDIAIGDFDSVTALSLAKVESDGAEVLRHPPDKDETDLELALLRALKENPDRIVVVALGGGRFDHYLANLFVLADERFAAVEVSALVDKALVTVVRGTRTLSGRVGDTLTLLPVHGAAGGVSTSGLEYRLDNATLPAGTTRGVSNVMRAPLAVVKVLDGVLLAIQPSGTGDDE